MKVLITSGCSFSDASGLCGATWPTFLEEILKSDYTHIAKGKAGHGNDYISRSIIYEVSQTLDKCKADDILVGIMWSGSNRYHYYSQLDDDKDNNKKFSFIPGNTDNWLNLEYYSESSIAKMYYKYFHDHVGAKIYTLENILRVQWFLKCNNIKYFMTTFTKETIPKFVSIHKDTKHLYDQIDFNNFLPVVGEQEWCREFTNLSFLKDNFHPSYEQQKLFTEQVIYPFLIDKGYIKNTEILYES